MEDRPPWESFLVRHWRFDETDNGTAIDATGRSAGLTAENAPTSAAGKVGTSRLVLAASNQSFSEADTADLAFDSSTAWEINGWIYPTSLASIFVVASKGPAASMNLFMSIFSGYGLRLEYRNDGLSVGVDLMTGAGTAVVNAWHFVRAWLDPTVGARGTAYLSLNNSTTLSAALTGNVTDNPGAFYIGKRADNFFRANSRFDAFRVFKGHNANLHAAAMGEYYHNGGNGR